MSTPIRAAVGASSATARIPCPIFVRDTRRSKKNIITTAEMMVISWMTGPGHPGW